MRTLISAEEAESQNTDLVHQHSIPSPTRPLTRATERSSVREGTLRQAHHGYRVWLLPLSSNHGRGGPLHLGSRERRPAGAATHSEFSECIGGWDWIRSYRIVSDRVGSTRNGSNRIRSRFGSDRVRSDRIGSDSIVVLPVNPPPHHHIPQEPAIAMATGGHAPIIGAPEPVRREGGASRGIAASG